MGSNRQRRHYEGTHFLRLSNLRTGELSCISIIRGLLESDGGFNLHISFSEFYFNFESDLRSHASRYEGDSEVQGPVLYSSM